MFLIFFALIANAFMLTAGVVGTLAVNDVNRLNPATLQSDIATIGAAMDQYYAVYNQYAPSLAAMASTPGFEYLAPYTAMPTIYGYKAVLANDGTYTFNRAAAFQLNSKVAQSSDDYTSINTCGAGAFAVASTWCGSTATPWVVRDNRLQTNAGNAAEYDRQQLTAAKITRSYNLVNTTTFPTIATSPATMASLVGYAGTAANCAGAFVLWGGVVLDCTDLYSTWATDVQVSRASSTQIQISSTAPASVFLNSDGVPVSPATTVTIN